jgi:hypothetical protein
LSTDQEFFLNFSVVRRSLRIRKTLSIGHGRSIQIDSLKPAAIKSSKLGQHFVGVQRVKSYFFDASEAVDSERPPVVDESARFRGRLRTWFMMAVPITPAKSVTRKVACRPKVFGSFDHPRSRRVVIHTNPKTNKPVTIVPIASEMTVRRIHEDTNLLTAHSFEDKAVPKNAPGGFVQPVAKPITTRTLYTIERALASRSKELRSKSSNFKEIPA